MVWLCIYIIGIIAMFTLVVVDDTRGVFSETYDKAYGTNSTANLEASNRGWTATWVSFFWPITMTLFTFVMLYAYIKVHIIDVNPLNMLYDKIAEMAKKD